MIHFSIFFTLLLPAPATGVDAASLSPHEVLPRAQSVVRRATERCGIGWPGGGEGEGAALESASVQNSCSIRIRTD